MSNLEGDAGSGIGILDESTSASDKAKYVQKMFDDISLRYDFLNTALSAGLHWRWRSFATRCAAICAGDDVLDVCSGTGEWAADLRRTVGANGSVTAVDFSFGMLQTGLPRFTRFRAVPLQADALCLPFVDNVFQAATVAFGIRNVADVHAAFAEMARVVRPGGRVVCLEFSQVEQRAFKAIYEIYSRFIMPRIGGIFSSRPEAYSYLPESVVRFKTKSELAEIMESCGLRPVRVVTMMFGLVAIHVGVK